MAGRWNKIERIKLDENFQPDKIFVTLLDEGENEIRTEKERTIFQITCS